MFHLRYRLSSHSPGRAPHTTLLLSKLEDFGSEWDADEAEDADDAVLQMKKKLPLVSRVHNHLFVPSEGPVDS